MKNPIENFVLAAHNESADTHYKFAVVALEASADKCTDPTTAGRMRAVARFLLRTHLPADYARLEARGIGERT